MINAIPRLFSWILVCTSLLMTANESLFAKQDHDSAPIELSGFSMSEAFEIPDDQPLDLEAPILKQLLYRIQKTSPQSRLQYSHYTSALNWTDVTTKTEDHRLWLFDVQVTLKKIEKHRFQNVSPEEAIQGVYVCHCETKPDDDQSGERGHTFVVLARAIPKALPVDVAIDEPIRVTGFLYSRVSGLKEDENNVLPVFVVDRVAWYPGTQSENTSAALVKLSANGFDVGLLDLVRENNTPPQPLDSRDAEAFFQVLAAVDRMDELESDSEVNQGGSDSKNPKLGFNDLMQNSNANFGQATQVRGVVRTCSLINVPHPDIQNRLGVKKYYQLMMFPDLDGAKVVVKTQDGKEMDYRRFPITICCTDLPPGMSAEDVERKQFVVDGYFFRFWKYQSRKTDLAETGGQVSPLIIAKRPVLIESDAGRLNFVLLVFTVVVIAGIIALIGGFRIADQIRKPPGRKVRDALPDQIDLSGLDE